MEHNYIHSFDSHRFQKSNEITPGYICQVNSLQKKKGIIKHYIKILQAFTLNNQWLKTVCVKQKKLLIPRSKMISLKLHLI